jgi:geranylgeranyl pyrophosphate synthase
MEALISDCENTFNELSQFSANILSLSNIVDDRLEVFEKEIGYSLPFDLNKSKHVMIVLFHGLRK